MTELRSVACHMGSHSITCHPTQANTPRINPSQWRLVLDLPTPDGWKAELTWVAGYIPRWFIRPQTVTHPSTNWARRRVTTLIETNVLPLCQTTTTQAWLLLGVQWRQPPPPFRLGNPALCWSHPLVTPVLV